MDEQTDKTTGWRGSRELWLGAAKEALIERGIAAVKIQPLAARLDLSRTSFYWFFEGRADLLDALLDDWEATNTGALTEACAAYAATAPEAMLTLIAVFVSETRFEPRFDTAIRGWAHADATIAARVAQNDAARLDAIRALFERLGFDATEADVRARTVYLTQVGYIALQMAEDRETRLARVPGYVTTYCGTPPSEAEMARFRAAL